MKWCIWLAAVLAVVTLPVAGAAQSRESATFDIYVRGVRAAQIGISAIEANGRYSAAAKMQATGLIGAVRTLTYSAKAQGAVSGSTYVPSLYEERRVNGPEVRTARMAYRRGVPQGRELTPPRPPSPTDVDPATQGGTWDLMTALYAVLRTVPRDRVCTMNQYLFDGRRRMQIVLGSPKPDGEGRIACNAEFRRIAGYPQREMDEGRVFPFRLTYERTGGGWLVREVSMSTVYGRGAMVRR